MCNCGNKRSQYNQENNVSSGQIKTSTITSKQYTNSIFEYVGKTALTVVGNITGRRYRFNRPGDLQSIDSRDADGMLAVPVLRRK
jgi:hypothetical protein